jgi:hypothetical protein
MVTVSIFYVHSLQDYSTVKKVCIFCKYKQTLTEAYFFWDMMQCSLLKDNRYFRGTYWHYFQIQE